MVTFKIWKLQTILYSTPVSFSRFTMKSLKGHKISHENHFSSPQKNPFKINTFVHFDIYNNRTVIKKEQQFFYFKKSIEDTEIGYRGTEKETKVSCQIK